MRGSVGGREVRELREQKGTEKEEVNIQSIVVFPAASRPSNKMRACFMLNLSHTLPNKLPISFLLLGWLVQIAVLNSHRY